LYVKFQKFSVDIALEPVNWGWCTLPSPCHLAFHASLKAFSPSIILPDQQRNKFGLKPLKYNLKENHRIKTLYRKYRYYCKQHYRIAQDFSHSATTSGG